MANTDYRDGFLVSNASATQGPFSLLGGKYGVTAVATGTGTIALQILGPDGSTYVTTFTAFATTAGYAVIDLPPGKYQVAIATFTAVYVSVIPISYRK